MKKTALALLFIVFSWALCGCQSGKKFDSAEQMIASVVGTYCASDDHSGEYIIVNKENIIKFNINDIFPKQIDEKFFKNNFSDEDWKAFNIDVLLDKPYTKVSVETISADVKNSTLSDLWIDKDGTLYSQKKNGYPLKKILSESNYPTDEMQEMFKTFSLSLQEYEISSIIKDAENKCLEIKKTLDSKLDSAAKTSSIKKECTASAEVIGLCAFESLKSSIKYPASAELLDYSTTPQKDSYGRVLTRIRFKSQNGFGNFITQDIFVILQSCTESGEYTYNSGSNFWIDDGSSASDNLGLNLLLTINNFDKDPNFDSGKDPTYLEAIELAKSGDYESAIKKLETIKGYRFTDEVISACENYIRSQDYKNAVNLFADKKYSEAAEKLASLITVDKDGNEAAYLKTKRIIYLCSYLSNDDMKNNAASSNDGSQNNSNGKSGGVDSNINSTDKNNSGNSNTDSDNSNSNNPEIVNNNSGDNNLSSSTSSGSNTGSGGSSGNNAGDNNLDNSISGNTSVVHTHSYADATCTEPKTCTVCGETAGSVLGHTWEAVYSTVHHDQEGHNELVKVKDGYTWYHCPICGDEFKSLDSYYSHFDSSHSDVSFLRDDYTHGSVYDQYEETWVIDKEAYDETVIIEYRCSKCSETKQ